MKDSLIFAMTVEELAMTKLMSVYVIYFGIILTSTGAWGWPKGRTGDWPYQYYR
ncbi:hypothetical protein ACSBR2_001818 [Camellia fascicularis]